MENKGLTTAEAKKLHLLHGPNQIAENHSFRLFAHLLSELFSIMNLLLLAAGGLSLFISDMVDAIMIFAVITINTGISFYQEYKAEKTLEELKKISPASCRAIRDGRQVSLYTEQLVPGDLVLLETGDRVPADGLVIESLNLVVNEAPLTGESVPVYKKPQEAEHNQVFAGTLVSSGRARVKITATGRTTRFGKIAETLSGMTDTDTPLQKQIRKLGIYIAFCSIALSAVIFGLGMLLHFDKFEIFLVAMTSAVAWVPEGLPSIILVTLAVGVKRMAQRRAVVRKMIAIEALGSINIIATDKTGTLTMGEMRVSHVWFDGQARNDGEFRPLLKDPKFQRLIDGMVVVNTSSLALKFGKDFEVLGDPTEGALLIFARDLGIDYEIHKRNGQIVDEFSFDQELKSMSAVWESGKETVALVKSSPEFIVLNSSRIYSRGEVRAMTEEDRGMLTQAYGNFAKKGLRIIGFGYKDITERRKYERNEIEKDLVFLGFAALRDPIRPEVKGAIQMASIAGIRTVMITGDNELTAMAVAQELGLSQADDETILGQDLAKLTDEQLTEQIGRIKVFARTTPQDKLRIVRAFQSAGYNVAVTGDGINDALALKQAEIGVAMGRKGTDVAKEAADIVITDDNYKSIVKAVEEGRTIYDNVLKSIRYLLSTNIGEAITILLALFAGFPTPFLPVQILWLNLVTDSLPAIALALDPKDPNAMRRKPLAKNHPLIGRRGFLQLIAIGVFIGLVCDGTYIGVLTHTNNVVLARTWTFTIMIALQMIIVFLVHGFHNAFNKKLIAAVLITLLIQFLI
ncbi:MAG: cation-translocating P-type ATPase, partial [Candidatus Saccharibacteria bacterium]